MKILVICYVTTYTLKKQQAVWPSETLAIFCKTALCYFTEDSKEPSKVIQFVTFGGRDRGE